MAGILETGYRPEVLFSPGFCVCLRAVVTCCEQWTGPGLNRRPKDFQSFALPIQLPVPLRLNSLVLLRFAIPGVNRPPRPAGYFTGSRTVVRPFFALSRKAGRRSGSANPAISPLPVPEDATSADRTSSRYLLENISSRFNNTLPTTVQAANSTASAPCGSGPSGTVASCSAFFGSLR